MATDIITLEQKEKATINRLVGKHLVHITAGFGLLQGIFSVLAAVDRLNPTVPSNNITLQTFTDDTFWAGIYLLSACVVAISLAKVEMRGVGMAITSAVLMVWGFLCFFRSLTAIHPVALSLSVAVFFLGIFAGYLCSLWNDIAYGTERL